MISKANICDFRSCECIERYNFGSLNIDKIQETSTETVKLKMGEWRQIFYPHTKESGTLTMSFGLALTFCSPHIAGGVKVRSTILFAGARETGRLVNRIHLKLC